MKKYIIIQLPLMVFISVLFVFSACNIKDGYVECPEGNIRILFYAEQFQNVSDDPLAAREAVFTQRVNHLRYFLYKDGELFQEGTLDKLPESAAPDYAFRFNGIGYGNYTMIVVANCTKKSLLGNPVNPDNLVLTFPGCSDTEDFFTAVFPFTIDSNNPVTYEVGLLRTHGVIRYKFVNLPDHVSDIDVRIENVTSQKWITGDYMTAATADSRYVIVPLSQQRQRAAGDTPDTEYIMGTFPTLSNERATYHLGLYRSGETTPYRREMITDTLTIRRNHLIEVVATFDANEDVSFQINLDPTWEGSNVGGEVEIQ